MIKIKGLNKSYIRGKEIIPNLDIEFADTGLTVIAGKSGCGKTTLLNIVGAMDLDYNGEVVVDGIDLHKMSYGQIVDYRNFSTAFVFQKNSLFEFLTVEENLKLCMNIQNNHANINDALEKVGLKGFAHKKVKALSGGEKQRVAIARALIKNCKIIFADEPTSALDTKNGHKIFQLFKEISKDKLVIIVTHDVKKAELYADRVVRFVDGSVVEDHIINDVKEEARILPVRKTKKFALVPIFFHSLKKGLAINLFIMLLMIAALTITNLAIEQAIVKAEYDYFGTDNQTDFNIDRAIQTQISNNIDLFNVVKRENVDDAYHYIKTADINNSVLNEADSLILSQYLKDYSAYYGAKDASYKYLSIEGISTRAKYSRSGIGGFTRYWYGIVDSPYTYYLYDENCQYNILDGGRVPEEVNEVMVTDVVAYQYLANEIHSISRKPGDPIPPVVLEKMLDVELTIYDTYGVYVVDSVEKYNIGDPKTFKVTGVINTGLLSYYTYDANQKKYIFNNSLKTQDNNRNSIFMNSLKSQPFGYVVMMEDLKGSSEKQFYYNNYNIENITFSTKTTTYQSSNIPMKAFLGAYDYTTNPVEMYDREKNKIKGTHEQYLFEGYVDNIKLDINNRILYKTTTKDNLVDNEIILTPSLAKELYPELLFDTTAQIRNSFEIIANQEIKINIKTIEGNKDITVKIVGIAKDNTEAKFYVSEEIFSNIYSFSTNFVSAYTLNLLGTTVNERKTLMENLFNLGYSLVPIDTMPSSYLEFVEGKGETLAEVNYEGLISLYPMATIEAKDSDYYFVNEGVIFGAVDDANNPTIVYMQSSMIKRIVLDESFYTSLGNLSLYYLYSMYYTNDGTNTGNYILEILSSMYLFLLGMAVLISVGFIYLKESREKDTIVKLSMLGVRPRHMYLIHLITYTFMTIIICGGTILLTNIFVNVINKMFAYEVVNKVGDTTFLSIVHRYRLLFTELSYQYAISISVSLFVIFIISTILVTRICRK